MTSYGDLERAVGEFGSDEWFRPQLGIVDCSGNPRLWTEPFDVLVGRNPPSDQLVWRGNLDVTAELSFEGPTPVDWLGPIDATYAQILNVSILYRGTTYLTLSGLAVQPGCGDDNSFDPSSDFWVLPIPRSDGTLDESAYGSLHDAVSQLADIELLDVEELLAPLGRQIGHSAPESATELPASEASTRRLIRSSGHSARQLRGPRTQEYDFYIPILAALVQLGGEAPARQVLQIVEQKMMDDFTPDDLLPIPSSPNYPRWDKTANWARQELAELGYIVRPGRYGIWEISDSGRAYLTKEIGRTT